MIRRPSGKGDYAIGYGKPPAETRFPKGRSGNPSGRPRRSAATSPFDLVLDQTLTVGADGAKRQVTPEEALQPALLQKAFAGDRPAIRKVLKMIQKRQAAVTAMADAKPTVEFRWEVNDPDNANDALRLLGIADDRQKHGRSQLLLHAWAIQAALDKPKPPLLRGQDIILARNSCLDPAAVSWPGAME